MVFDKVLCPWCGAEMRGFFGYSRHNDWHGFGWYECERCKATGPAIKGWKTAAEAERAGKTATLRRYTPPQKPMTLEEFWKEDDLMWVEHKNGALYIGDFYVSMSAKNGWDVQTLGSAKPRLLLEDYYGKTWRCWERNPTDEERSAAEWET